MKQLIPVTGALMAGLIGVASADCFGFTTSVCLAADSTVDGCYLNCNGNCHGLYATGDWYAYNAFQITEPGTGEEAATWADTFNCSGNASYIDCNGYPHTISTYDYQHPSNTYYGPSSVGYPPPCTSY